MIRRPVTALLALVVVLGCETRPDPAPTVGLAEVVRGEMTLTRGGVTDRVEGSARVEVDTVVHTAENGRGSVALDSGAWILFDRNASGTPSLAGLHLDAGRVWVDASVADDTTIETAQGSLVAHEAAFAVSIEDGATVVYCASGELSYRSGDTEAQLVQGETLRMTGSDAIAEPAALWDDWTGGLADPARGRFREHDPIGTLRGRTAYDLGVARTPLPIRSHEVEVEIRGDLAITTVTQTFFNARPDTLEGEWRIRIPEDAIVDSFAVDMGTGFVDAVPLATGIGSAYTLTWYGPEYGESRLAYDAPGRLRARISPITNRTEVRVRIRWSEWLHREGDRRTYVYPMRTGGGEPPLLSEFMMSIDTRSARVGALRAGMGATDESGRVTLRVSDFRPRADFTLDLFDPEGAAPASAIAYPVSAPGTVFSEVPAEGDETYVLFDLDTASMGEAAAEEAPLELVILLDASGATETEDLEIARAVVEATLAQLAPTDRVTVRIADVTAHVPEGGSEDLVAPEAGGEALADALARLEPSGATDLGESLRAAAEIVAGRPRGAVLYLGDGLPTTGAMDATSLRTVLATVDAPPRFFALAIGEGANLDLLRALFGGGARAVQDREGAARTVMSLLAEAARPTLRGVTVALGEGIERVFPRGPLTAPVGGHLVLVGRQAGELPSELTVRGTRDGASFETTLPVVRDTVTDDGHVRRRWASSRLAELLDDDAGREALVELGTRFGIVTPWTSLVVGGYPGQTIPLVRGFDPDPLEVPWGIGGGGVSSSVLESSRDGGWRRRVGRGAGAGMGIGSAVDDAESAPESTWAPRVRSADVGAVTAAEGDGGLARAAIERTLDTSDRGPEGCFERRTIVRPDLSGDVRVSVTVRGDGSVEATDVTSSSVGDAEIEDCVRTEVSGISFPATEGGTVVVTHVYSFRTAERELGARRTCSDASREPLEVRRSLWTERLGSRPGVDGALQVWRDSRAACELDSWRARRVLADLLLGHVGGLYPAVALYQQIGGDPSVRSYLRRAILRRARTPSDIDYLRRALGLEPNVTWWLFGRLWNATTDAAARLRLVRRWLAVAPDDLDLRLRLLSLLEQTGDLGEARRVARELRADPLADARVRTDVGEFWLRQGDEAEARRVFSEIVEHTPLDPWARRRLGDLYRAHEWADDAYREYQTLAHLRPDDDTALLLLARAAANAGRIDEALRLEQRLSETADEGADEGAASAARLWTTVRLARLASGDADEALRESIRRRVRESGVLRDPPAALVALVFEHPDDAPTLSIHWPDREDPTALEPAELGSVASGVLGIRIRERGEGDHLLVVTRPDADSLRDWHAELVVILRPGTPEERILREDVVLTRTERTSRVLLTAGDTITPAPPLPSPRSSTTRPAAP